MKLTFYKYQGTGNDFVLIDNRELVFPKEDSDLIAFLCNRRFGIGADGLILLEKHDKYDFNMVYYNSDGNTSTMCGNGGRCMVAFAKYLGIIDNHTTFGAIDGMHTATIKEDVVSLQMQDVFEISNKPNAFFINTGSPHHVQMVKDLANLNVTKEGAKLRYGLYGESGSNINFVEQKGDNIFAVRTYERGVEDETLSCGTGVTAVALAMHSSGRTKEDEVDIFVKGGELKVKFTAVDGYTNILLIGSTKQVFKGEVQC